MPNDLFSKYLMSIRRVNQHLEQALNEGLEAALLKRNADKTKPKPKISVIVDESSKAIALCLFKNEREYSETRTRTANFQGNIPFIYDNCVLFEEMDVSLDEFESGYKNAKENACYTYVGINYISRVNNRDHSNAVRFFLQEVSLSLNLFCSIDTLAFDFNDDFSRSVSCAARERVNNFYILKNKMIDYLV